MLKEITDSITQNLTTLQHRVSVNVIIPYPWKRRHHIGIIWGKNYIACRAVGKTSPGSMRYVVLASPLPAPVAATIDHDYLGSCFLPDFAAQLVDTFGNIIDGRSSLLKAPMSCLTELLGEEAAVRIKGAALMSTPPTRVERGNPKVGFPVGKRWAYVNLQNVVQIKDYLFFTLGSVFMDSVGIMILPDGLREVSGAQLSRSFVKLREPVVVDLPVVTSAAAGFREEMMEDLLYSLGN